MVRWVGVDVDCWVVEKSTRAEVPDAFDQVECATHLGLGHVHVGVVAVNELADWLGQLFLERVVPEWGLLKGGKVAKYAGQLKTMYTRIGQDGQKRPGPVGVSPSPEACIDALFGWWWTTHGEMEVGERVDKLVSKWLRIEVIIKEHVP